MAPVLEDVQEKTLSKFGMSPGAPAQDTTSHPHGWQPIRLRGHPAIHSRYLEPLVPVPTDEGTDVLKEAMGLAQRHTQQGKISICQTPYPVLLARHHCQ